MKIEFTADDLEAIRLIIREEISRAQKQEQKLYTRTELCETLGIDYSTYHNHVKAGKLKVKKIGRKLQIVQ
jgi:predicted DNA-binding protein (UPF0251 family)